MKKLYFLLLAISCISCDDTFDFLYREGVSITSIKIKTVANDGNLRDIIAYIANEDGKILFQSEIKHAVDPIGLSLEFTDPLLPLVHHRYKILVYGMDNGVKELMGSADFNPKDFEKKLERYGFATSPDCKLGVFLKWGDPDIITQ